nr:hypothetical protein [Tanacetum cinerariifolium]
MELGSGCGSRGGVSNVKDKEGVLLGDFTHLVPRSNDVTRLQALVDKKKVVVTEAAIKDALHLDDAEGVD